MGSRCNVKVKIEIACVPKGKEDLAVQLGDALSTFSELFYFDLDSDVALIKSISRFVDSLSGSESNREMLEGLLECF